MSEHAHKYIKFIMKELEGGYVNHPSDPGGETNHGITKRTAMAHGYNGSMKLLTPEIAEEIYFKSYWVGTLAEKAPRRLSLHLLDMNINSGPRNSTRTLQRALGLAADGIAGPKTMEAIKTTPEDEIILRFNIARMEFYANIGNFKTFGKGWTNRLLLLARAERLL